MQELACYANFPFMHPVRHMSSGCACGLFDGGDGGGGGHGRVQPHWKFAGCFMLAPFTGCVVGVAQMMHLLCPAPAVAVAGLAKSAGRGQGAKEGSTHVMAYASACWLCHGCL